MFHFVTGGVTPAALAADWLTSAIDQNAFSWVNSPLASRLEQSSIDWLKDLFGLPATWGGVLTTGATMANFSALAAARHWWGERYGVDIEEQGLGARRDPITVLAGGYFHTSAAKAVAMLGIGAVASGDSGRRIGRLDLRRWRPPWPTWTAGPVDPRRDRRRRGYRRLRPHPRRWPTWPSATAPGCTSMARSGCSPAPPRRRRISSTASTAPIRSSPTATSG